MRARESRSAITLCALACALAGCGALGSDDAEGTSLAHHSWLGYHWAGAAPVRVSYVDDLAAKRSPWREHLAPAAAAWVRAGLQTEVTLPSTRARGCVLRDGLVEICSVTARDAGWLATTSVWTASGSSTEILRAQIQLNDAYVREHDASSQRRVVCHEMGHALGLGHTDDPTSCMNERTHASPVPNAHDFELLDATYPAPATTPTALSAIIADDAHVMGRHQLTAHDEANGHRRFTWTTPAPRVARRW